MLCPQRYGKLCDGLFSFPAPFWKECEGSIIQQLTEKSGEDRPVTEYVESLKVRLRDSWKLAVEHDDRTKQKVKQKFDKKTVKREFQVGDQVLILLPTATGSLEDKWSGPYVIEAKVNDVTYRVRTPDRRKKSRLFHINGLKQWSTPITVMAVHYCEEKLPDALEPELIPFEKVDGGKPTISNHLTEEQWTQLDHLLEDELGVFGTQPGHTEVVEHSVDTGEAKPVFHPPYRLPPAWQEEVRSEIGNMLEAGVIVPSKSPWTSPLVPIRKKDGGVRLCVDYRKLNMITEDDRCPMPRVEELLEELGRAKFISTLDLVKGYYRSLRTDARQPSWHSWGNMSLCVCPSVSKELRQLFKGLWIPYLVSVHRLPEHTWMTLLFLVQHGKSTWHTERKSLKFCNRLDPRSKHQNAVLQCSTAHIWDMSLVEERYQWTWQKQKPSANFTGLGQRRMYVPSWALRDITGASSQIFPQ